MLPRHSIRKRVASTLEALIQCDDQAGSTACSSRFACVISAKRDSARGASRSEVASCPGAPPGASGLASAG